MAQTMPDALFGPIFVEFETPKQSVTQAVFIFSQVLMYSTDFLGLRVRFEPVQTRFSIFLLILNREPN